MARITYKPAPGDPATTEFGGQRFEAGKAVDVKNPAILAKANNNPFFEVSGASKEEQRQAEVVGGYADANTGEEVELVRRPRTLSYGVTGGGPTGPVPPTAATQGSTAVETTRPVTTTAANPAFEETYGGTPDEVARGEHEGAPEYQGPEGTVATGAKRDRPAGSKSKK